jgi:hypothetical protein
MNRTDDTAKTRANTLPERGLEFCRPTIGIDLEYPKPPFDSTVYLRGETKMPSTRIWARKLLKANVGEVAERLKAAVC